MIDAVKRDGYLMIVGGDAPDQGGGGGPSFLGVFVGAFTLPALGFRRGGILGANGFSPPAVADSSFSGAVVPLNICAEETIFIPSYNVSPEMAVSMPLLSPLVTK